MSLPAALRRRLPDRSSLLLTGLAWVPLLCWYTALAPGIMTSDSLDGWRQVVKGDWVDLHPPAYTSALAVSSWLTGGPALVALGQSLFLAAGVVALGRAVVRLGASPWFAAAIAAGLVCTPMVGAFSMSIWKDVPFAAAFLFLAARVVDLVRAEAIGDRTGVRDALWSVAAWAVVLAAMRQNGVVLVAGVGFVLALSLRAHWRQVAVVVAVPVATVVVLKAVVYPIASVEPATGQQAIATLLHDIAALAAERPHVLDAEDVQLLESVAPLSTWQSTYRGYTCISANWQWLRAFRWDRVEGRVGEYVRLWWELAREQPRAVLASRLCAGSVAYRPYGGQYLYTVNRGVDPNPYGLRTEPLVDALHGPAVDAIDWTDRPSVQWLLWRAPPWLYLFYLTLIVTAVRLRWPRLALVAVPLLALQVTVLVLNPSQDARYMLPDLLGALLLLPLVSLRADRLKMTAVTSVATKSRRSIAGGDSAGRRE